MVEWLFAGAYDDDLELRRFRCYAVPLEYLPSSSARMLAYAVNISRCKVKTEETNWCVSASYHEKSCGRRAHHRPGTSDCMDEQHIMHILPTASAFTTMTPYCTLPAANLFSVPNL